LGAAETERVFWMKPISKFAIVGSALWLLIAVACERAGRDSEQEAGGRLTSRPEEQKGEEQERAQRELWANADKNFAEAVSKLNAGEYRKAGELLLLVRKENPEHPGLKAKMAEVIALRDKAVQGEQERAAQEGPTVQLKGDTVGFPDGTKSRPVAVVAASEEDLYRMMKSLAASDIDGFFDVIREERGTLLPAGTTAKVLERRRYREFEVAHIEITSGELKGRRLWTHPFFLP
jgi:hypothetical protein